jgi:hypothetical protein
MRNLLIAAILFFRLRRARARRGARPRERARDGDGTDELGSRTRLSFDQPVSSPVEGNVLVIVEPRLLAGPRGGALLSGARCGASGVSV